MNWLFFDDSLGSCRMNSEFVVYAPSGTGWCRSTVARAHISDMAATSSKIVLTARMLVYARVRETCMCVCVSACECVWHLCLCAFMYIRKDVWVLSGRHKRIHTCMYLKQSDRHVR